MDYKHHVFLSYSHKDGEVMQRVRDSLRTAGLGVWTDEGIEPGTPLWKDSIQEAIETAGCLVVILSPDAKGSIWVKRELEYAEIQHKRLFPLLASGNETNAIPFGVIGSQFVDIRSNFDFEIQKLIQTLLASFRPVLPAISSLFNDIQRNPFSVSFSEQEVQEEGDLDEEDELYVSAVLLSRKFNRASIVFLQRRLRIGYTRADRILKLMEQRGIIKQTNDSGPDKYTVIPE